MNEENTESKLATMLALQASLVELLCATRADVVLNQGLLLALMKSSGVPEDTLKQLREDVLKGQFAEQLEATRKQVLAVIRDYKPGYEPPPSDSSYWDRPERE